MSGQLGHWPLGLDQDGRAETDWDLIEIVVCATCEPPEEWPCEAFRAGDDDMPEPLF